MHYVLQFQQVLKKRRVSAHKHTRECAFFQEYFIKKLNNANEMVLNSYIVQQLLGLNARKRV